MSSLPRSGYRVKSGVRARIRSDPKTTPRERMNRTESKYAELLEAKRLAGEILYWEFERIKIRLGQSCYYTPDFLVIDAQGRIEFHEVKGFWRDDARVKSKVAAEAVPWAGWFAYQLKGGQWVEEDLNPKDRKVIDYEEDTKGTTT